MDKITQMKELIVELNNASNAYYNSNKSVMSDYDFDLKLEELKQLEKEIGIVFSNSPTHNVGYNISDELAEVEHNHPMLSLDKTKSINELIQFAGYNNCFLSVKCDGLTTSLRYLNGKLISAETRGNGTKGQDVLQNVLTMNNVPKEIPYKDELIIDGETIIGWDTFREINAKLPMGQKYKHPRNLVSGSLQLLDSQQAAERHMRFIAWRVIKGFSHKSVFFDLKEAEKNGFEIVPTFTYSNTSSDLGNISKILDALRNQADLYNIPYDGAVMAIDNYAIAESMGRTDKFFKHSIAYKYEDELYETVLKDIEWSVSKSGLINPIAVFDPVDLSGAITTRATLHNITYIKDMMLGIGDRIRIYRSNMVIPKVHDSIDKSGNFNIPTHCPICHQPAIIKKDNDSEVLICTNEYCEGKLLKRLSHAVSKNALNIENLSEASLKRFIQLGYVKSIKDIYHLEDFKEQIQSLEGFGQKSVEKLLSAIQKSRNTTLAQFLYSLSIPLLGKSASKDISKVCENDFEVFVNVLSNKGRTAFTHIDGIGIELAMSMTDYWNKYNLAILDLANELIFEKEKENSTVDTLQGKSFCITGKLISYSNRAELVKEIESHGGKVVSSVTKKTDYLINNDTESVSSKNKTAKSLGIPIISEVKFKQMIEGEK